MTDLVRVSDRLTGHHYTTTRANAEANKSRLSVLKQDATDNNGHPLPPKFKEASVLTPDSEPSLNTDQADQANDKA